MLFADHAHAGLESGQQRLALHRLYQVVVGTAELPVHPLFDPIARGDAERRPPIAGSTELPEQVQKALNPLKASKKASKKK